MRPEASEQIKIFKEHVTNIQFSTNEYAYLISMKWLQKWYKSVGFYNKEPTNDCPPIDNKDIIINEGGENRRVLMEGIHHFVVKKDMWDLFVKWYGGGPEIKVEVGFDPIRKQNIPDVHPLTLHIFYAYSAIKKYSINNNHDSQHANSNHDINFITIQFSKYKTADMLRNIICEKLQISPSKFSLFMLNSISEHIDINSTSKNHGSDLLKKGNRRKLEGARTLSEYHISNNQQLILDVDSDFSRNASLYKTSPDGHQIQANIENSKENQTVRTGILKVSPMDFYSNNQKKKRHENSNENQETILNSSSSNNNNDNDNKPNENLKMSESSKSTLPSSASMMFVKGSKTTFNLPTSTSMSFVQSSILKGEHNDEEEEEAEKKGVSTFNLNEDNSSESGSEIVHHYDGSKGRIANLIPNANQNENNFNTFAGYNHVNGSKNQKNTPYLVHGPSQQIGICGFVNLGNSCFFNSSLQSLLHTMPLINHFLNDHWKSEMSLTNKLGTKGACVTAFVSIAERVWAGLATVVAPRHLFGVIQRYAPHFNGYAQQDAHELLLFLLDMIHEDLNRVKAREEIKEREELRLKMLQEQEKANLKSPKKSHKTHKYGHKKKTESDENSDKETSTPKKTSKKHKSETNSSNSESSNDDDQGEKKSNPKNKKNSKPKEQESSSSDDNEDKKNSDSENKDKTKQTEKSTDSEEKSDKNNKTDKSPVKKKKHKKKEEENNKADQTSDSDENKEKFQTPTKKKESNNANEKEKSSNSEDDKSASDGNNKTDKSHTKKKDHKKKHTENSNKNSTDNKTEKSPVKKKDRKKKDGEENNKTEKECDSDENKSSSESKNSNDNPQTPTKKKDKKKASSNASDNEKENKPSKSSDSEENNEKDKSTSKKKEHKKKEHKSNEQESKTEKSSDSEDNASTPQTPTRKKPRKKKEKHDDDNKEKEELNQESESKEENKNKNNDSNEENKNTNTNEENKNTNADDDVEEYNGNDDEYSAKAWRVYKSHNDSIVVDTFHGLLRSKIRCPNCKSSAVMFDPFVSISLPITTHNQLYQICFVPYDVRLSQMNIILPIPFNSSKEVFEVSLFTEIGRTCRVVYAQVGESIAVNSNNYNNFNTHNDSNSDKMIPKSQSMSALSSSSEFNSQSGNKFVSYSLQYTSVDVIANPLPPNKNTKTYVLEVPDEINYCAIARLAVKVKGLVNSTIKHLNDLYIVEIPNESPSKEEVAQSCKKRFGYLWNNRSEKEVKKDIHKKVKNENFIKEFLACQKLQQILKGKEIASFKKGDKCLKVKTNGYGHKFPRFKQNPIISSSIASVIINGKFMNESSGFNYQLLFRPNSDISHISPLPHPHKNMNVNYSNKKKQTLEGLLKTFTSPTLLDEDNKWYCPKCKEFVCADKKLDIWSLPKCFIINFKRFAARRNNRGYKKIETNIEFDEIVDFSPFVVGEQTKAKNIENLNENNDITNEKITDEIIENGNKKMLLYKLYAVIHHNGQLNGGHYTAHSFVESQNKWFFFNDNVVKESTQQAAHQSSAYILFYQRIDDDENEDSKQAH